MKILPIIALFLVLYFLYYYHRIKKAYGLAEVTYAKWAELGNKSNEKFRLLVLGDSIGTGVGASCFENSVAGIIAHYLAKKYRVTLINASVNGSKIKTLLNVIPEQKQDLTVIFISSNDAIRFTNLGDFNKDAGILLKKLSKSSKKLIIAGPANVGLAKFLPLPLRIVYLHRAPRYALILKKISAKFKNVSYINSLKPDNKLGKYKQSYYSSDLFHPNDEGYKFWFEMVKPYL